MDKKIWYAPNQFEAYGDEEIQAVTDSLKAGWLAGFGPKTIEFEKKVSERFGKKHGLFVNSGSSAILLGLSALNLKEDDEVITPACGFSTTVAPIIQVGAKPVFCDVQANGYYVPNIDNIRAVITNKTKVLLLPNLIGNLPDWEKIREAFPDLILFEDSADTITTTPWTDISTTSFYASHVITAGGIGGMVMFNSDDYLKTAIMYRDWGRIGDNIEEPSARFNYNIDGIPYDWKFLYGVIGYHLKCSEMNAAFGLAQWNKLDKLLSHRRKIIEHYLERLKDCTYYTLPNDSLKPNWLAIPLMCKNGDRLNLLTFLENNGVQTRVCFAGNITRHPAYREKYLKPFPISDDIMSNGFLLGAHHGMTIADVDKVTDLLIQFANTQNV